MKHNPKPPRWIPSPNGCGETRTFKVRCIFLVADVQSTDGWREWVGPQYTIRKIYKNSWGQKLRFYDFSNCVFSYSPCAPIIHVNFVSVGHINVPGALADPPTPISQKQKPTKRSVCVFGGSGWIRTTSGLSQQIYSLPRLSNSGARPELLCPPSRGKQRRPVFASLRRGTQFSILAIASVKIGGAGSGTRTRISSLEGLRTSPCTMPATSSQCTDYITYLPKCKW